jgi:DUF1365 family protein
MFNNSICSGIVWHKRYKTKEHEFFYKLNTWLIKIPKEDLNFKTITYKFRNKDYLRDEYHKYPNLLDRIYKKLNEFNIDNVVDEIFLLGQISNLGIYFSPLNLYFCYKNNQCNYILCEVSNTPWNERHYYILDTTNSILETNKNFHVSPFFGMNQTYKWQFNLTNNNIFFKIDSYENNIKVFSASYNATINDINNRKIIFKNMFNVYKIYWGIYYEALKLFIKKVPFIKHPRQKK